jgi:hypothetical protein
MWNTGGTGWNNAWIEITVDGVNYGTVKLPHAFDIYEGEETVLIPSCEVLFSWVGGNFPYTLYGFEIYNTLGEIIYTSPNDKPISGVFFTYQNECPFFVECLPVTDLEWTYIPEDNIVDLTWKAPESTYLTGFEIYRNEELIEQLPPSIISYSDSTEKLETGDYKYCVVPVYPFECDDLEETCVTIPIDVGINNFKDNIIIFPNPANDVINIMGVDVVNVKFFNNTGQLILSQNNTNTINISDLQNGIYLLSVETSTRQILQTKIIINH